MTEQEQSETRNTGYEFDLVDQGAVDEDDPMGQMSGFATRHDAIGIKAMFERRYGFDYDVRWFESTWREAEGPTVCDWCGFEEPYLPLVAWHVPSGFGEDNEGSAVLCSEECYRRWGWNNYPESFRNMEEVREDAE